MIGLKTMGMAARLRYWFVLALCHFGSVIASRSCRNQYYNYVTEADDFLCLHPEIQLSEFSAISTENYCNDLDGVLVMPKNEQMFTIILQAALEAGEYQNGGTPQGSGYLVWIGLSRVGTQKFVWADGTDLTWASAPWDIGADQPRFNYSEFLCGHEIYTQPI